MIGDFPDRGEFTVYSQIVDNRSEHKLSPQPPHVVYRRCGQRVALACNAQDIIDIERAGHRLLAIGLNIGGRSWTYGPP
jgi:hypothetical protein